MSERNLRLRWAKKVLQAKSFVVLTEKDHIIALKGTDPNSLNDVLALQEQAASLEDFLRRIKDLRDEHTQAIKKLLGEKTPASRSKKIKVKEG